MMTSTKPGLAFKIARVPEPSEARAATALLARVPPALKLTAEVEGAFTTLPAKTFTVPSCVAPVVVTFNETARADNGTPQEPAKVPAIGMLTLRFAESDRPPA